MINIQEFYNACDPVKPLDFDNPRERQYYIDFSSVRGDRVIDKMIKTICLSENSTCQLFTGHLGCGTTTELLRLKRRLEEENNFFVVYFKVWEEVNLNDVDVSDILLAIARRIIKSLEEDIQPPIRVITNRFQSFLENVAKFLNSEVTELEIKIPKVEDLDFRSKNQEHSLAFGLGEITLKAKEIPIICALLHQYVEPRINIILDILNDEVIEPAIEQLKQQGKAGLVVIVDGLQGVLDKPKYEGRNLLEYLFIDRGQQLRQLNCHKVYTIPIRLIFSNETRQLTDFLGGGNAPIVLPMIPVKLRDGRENVAGMNLLRQMVMARAFPDRSEDERLTLITQVFDSEETLDRLCKISGGHVLILLILLREGLIYEPSNLQNSYCLSRTSLEEAIKRNRENSRLTIQNQEEWKLLAQVAKHKKIIPVPEYKALLIKNLAIFEYHDEQGKWFDVNPILTETKEFHVSNLYELLQNCTVRVQSQGKAGYGTGFFVSPDLILICSYIVKEVDNKLIDIVWQNQTYSAEILQLAEPPGLALLRLQDFSLDHPCVYLDGSSIQPLDRLYSYGYSDHSPDGNSVTFETEGLTGDNPPLLKFKAGQVRPGMGGSPVLNTRTGKVCGIIFETRDRSSDLGGLALPTEAIFSSFSNLIELQQQFHVQNREWSNLLTNLQPTELLPNLELCERLKPCTVKLEFLGSNHYATGYFVSSDLILTCTHAVKQAENNLIRVSWQDRVNFAEATIQWINSESDIAILRLPDRTTDIPFIQLDLSESQPGDDLYSYGYADDYPNGCSVTFKCEGLAGGKPPKLTFTGGVVHPGFSGTPLLNLRTGKVCGIIQGTRDRNSALGGHAIPSTAIILLLKQYGLDLESIYRTEELLETQEPQNIYRPAINISQSQLFVAQRSQLTVALEPTTSEQDSIQIPENTAELYCCVNADGLHIANNTLPITFDPKTGQPLPVNFELQAHLRGDRPYTVQLFLENPDTGKVQIYETRGQIKVIPPEAPPERIPILPPLNIRVTRKPDLILHVESNLPDGDAGSHHLRYYFTTRLSNLRWREEPVGEVVLSPHDLSRLRALVTTTLQRSTNLSPADSREPLISLGTYLFDRLFPPETTAAFHDNFWQIADRLCTCLIAEDGVSWLPWELLVPYSDETESLSFFGERCQLSRWLQGLGSPRYDEIPLGDLAIAQYKFCQPAQQQQMAQDEQLTGWQRLLDATALSQGLQPALTPDNSVYAVHLLRYRSDLAREREIVPRGEIATIPASGEPEVRQARLNLRLKRPLVTLSAIAQPGEDGGYWLLPERVLPFLRAGASAVIAPWWETAEPSDRLFWAHFYQLLRQRLPLGEAVWRSRLAVRRTFPHSADWLAYTLFGDPCARAYEPEPSEGYAALECLNPDEPLRQGKTYYFRASLRNRPPVWYTDRLIQPEELPQQLQALFMAPGLQATFPKPLAMQPVGHTMRQATIELTPSAPGNYPLLVQLLEGDELVKTLQLNLEVQGGNDD